MKIILNKQEIEIADKATVEMLLLEKGRKRAVVWVNGKQLLISEYPNCVLHPGDQVRLLRVVAGG